MSTQIPDTEAEVVKDILARQELGLKKYGTTVAKNPLELRQWLQHSYEEKLDDALYMKRAIQELDMIIAAGMASAIDVDAITEQVTKALGGKLSGLGDIFGGKPAA